MGGVQVSKFRKHDLEIVVGPTGPLSEPTVWSGLEALDHYGVRGGHAHFPAKSGPKIKKTAS